MRLRDTLAPPGFGFMRPPEQEALQTVTKGRSGLPRRPEPRTRRR